MNPTGSAPFPTKDQVEIINSQIKMRDFWMPFAPSILDAKKG